MGEMTPKVSIAMCTYNGQRFLAQQLQSFLDQTYSPMSWWCVTMCRQMTVLPWWRLSLPVRHLP